MSGTEVVKADATYSPEQIELIKRTICKGASNDELALFVRVSSTKRLDPFSRQIYAIRRNEWDQSAKAYVDKMSIQTSIDGFRLIAERTGRYAGQVGPEWWDPCAACKSSGVVDGARCRACEGRRGAWVDAWLGEGYPAAARIGVIRKDFSQPLFAVAHFREYAVSKKDGGLVPMWARAGALMLAKCAESLALRRAFPEELSGLYTTEEMGQAMPAPSDDVDEEARAAEEFERATVVSASVRPEPKATAPGGPGAPVQPTPGKGGAAPARGSTPPVAAPAQVLPRPTPASTPPAPPPGSPASPASDAHPAKPFGPNGHDGVELDRQEAILFVEESAARGLRPFAALATALRIPSRLAHVHVEAIKDMIALGDALIGVAGRRAASMSVGVEHYAALERGPLTDVVLAISRAYARQEHEREHPKKNGAKKEEAAPAPQAPPAASAPPPAPVDPDAGDANEELADPVSAAFAKGTKAEF